MNGKRDTIARPPEVLKEAGCWMEWRPPKTDYPICTANRASENEKQNNTRANAPVYDTQREPHHKPDRRTAEMCILIHTNITCWFAHSLWRIALILVVYTHTHVHNCRDAANISKPDMMLKTSTKTEHIHKEPMQSVCDNLYGFFASVYVMPLTWQTFTYTSSLLSCKAQAWFIVLFILPSLGFNRLRSPQATECKSHIRNKRW